MLRSRLGVAFACLGLVVSLGCGLGGGGDAEAEEPTTVKVPDLVGDTMDTVKAQLDSAGLEGSATLAFGGTDWSAEAVVVGLSPAAGAEVERGSTVTISEATKAEIVFFGKPMPDLRGTRWLDSASGDLSAAHPYMKLSWRKPRGKEKEGSIVAQEPKAGTALKLGQPLKLTVADYSPVESGGEPASGWTPNVDVPNVCRRTKWC